VRAVDNAGGVELEFVAVAAQAVVLRSPALHRRRTRGTDTALRPVIREAHDVFGGRQGFGLRVFHSSD